MWLDTLLLFVTRYGKRAHLTQNNPPIMISLMAIYTARNCDHLSTFSRRKKLRAPFRDRAVPCLSGDLPRAASHNRAFHGENYAVSYTIALRARRVIAYTKFQI